MSFVYDKESHSAYDVENGIRIRMSSKFYDISDRTVYSYKEGDMEFEFEAFEIKELRTLVIAGKPAEVEVVVADTF